MTPGVPPGPAFCKGKYQPTWLPVHHDDLYTDQTYDDLYTDQTYLSLSLSLSIPHFFFPCCCTDGTWGPNTQMFVNAVGMHPDRLTNMYFAYVFVLRAIGKAGPSLMVRAVLTC